MTAPAAAELDCQDLVELLTEYLEDTLAPLRRQAVDAHLATCDGCETYLEQLRRTGAALGGLRAAGASTLPSELLSGLLGAFRGLRVDTPGPRAATT